MATFIFKHADISQREMIHGWLQQDYIHAWIHGQGLQNTLTGLEKFFQYQAKGKPLDNHAEITQHWIGYDGDKPFVYLLTYPVLAGSEYAKYRQCQGAAITLDIFIGNPDYVGKGLAARVIKEFLLNQCADVAEVFIDPEQSNHRAVHVYQKVGFKIVGEFIASWHPVPHYIMRLVLRELLTPPPRA